MSATSDTRPVTPRPPAAPGESQAAEMAAAWARGDCLPAEHYLALRPDLFASSEGAVRLIYEEVCLRQERGEEVSADELRCRFPRWADELAVILDCHQLVEARLAPPAFPVAGEALGEFRLVAELGRGARGRVFLATQPALAARAVVLKVSPRQDREFLSLARLQHTNIIPLLGVHDFPPRNLRGLCQPFLGGTSLAQLLETLRGTPARDRTGAALVAALDEVGRESPLPPPRGGPRAALAASSYAEAICWIGACLADALQHAHERGLVHLDLKPANVLLAADGTPLLLDFHLARHPIPTGRSAPEGLGGTPGYMSPEQQDAFAAGQTGLPISAPVDGRSDLYSLGRVLYDALGGRGGDGPTPPRLDRANPRVSVGLADIVHRCLAAAPAARYPDAGSLAADLRRHLAGQPLRGVRNRSLRERWRKWRRRRPHAGLWAGLLLALAAVPAVLGTVAVERFRSAREALADGQEQIRRGAYLEAERSLSRGRALAAWLPGTAMLGAEIEACADRARQASAAERLHAVCERLRLLAADELSDRDLRALDAHCRSAWDTRHLVGDAEDRALADVADLALLWADVKRRLALDDASQAGADALLAEAKALCGPRASSSRNGMALGRSLLRAGDLARAAAALARAADVRPDDFWAHFYGGVCAYRQGRHADAVHAFTVAVALSPRRGEAYHNRGLAHVGLGNADAARRDYDRALALTPDLSAASLNRGVLHYQQSRYAEALSDLERALRDGADPAACHFNLALVRLAEGDRSAASESVRRALEHAPAHAEARRLAERLGRER